MNVKKEYLILVVLIAGLSLYLALHKRDKSHYQLPELPKVVKKDISKVEISKNDKTIVLNKKDNVWHLVPQGYPADTSQVESMLDVIEKLSLTALVSESKDYERYNLDKDNKVMVKVWSGDTLSREFEIGKAATTFQHTFVKLGNDSRVYQARGNFRSKFDLNVDNLRDKIVLAFDPRDIQQMLISKGEKSIVFSRQQASHEITGSEEKKAQSSHGATEEVTWQSDEGKRGDESQLNRILTTLSQLHCEKYLDDRKKEDLADPIYVIELKGIKEHSLAVFGKIDETSNNYPATSSDNDYPFLLPSWQAKDLMKNRGQVSG
ncbi:MAG: DUF4340 domain-containing protein [Deltaproteobacteria bacterium]